MLKKRLISSTIIISSLIALMVLDFMLGRSDWLGRSGTFLCPLAVLMVCLATKELLDLFAGLKSRPALSIVILANAWLMIMACVPAIWLDYPVDCSIGKPGWALFGIASAIGILFLHEMMRFKEPGESISRLSLGVLCVGYIGVLATFLTELRLFHDNAWGMSALVSMIIITKVADIGAYTFGKSIGKHKMSPRLSPNKTIEGAIGALLCGCGCSALLFYTLIPWITKTPCDTPLWAMLVYGLIVTVAGMIGDLSESLLKRDSQQKDSSRWLPGLGGALDVIDSILVAAPAAFACWASGLIGPAM